MMERTKTLVAALCVVVAFGLLFLSVRSSTVADQSAPGLLPNAQVKPAPDFTLPDAATGKPVQLLAVAQVKPVVLDFWATWCGPCRAELPHLERLAQKYHGKVAFYGVNSSDSPAAITAFAKDGGLSFPTLSDSKHAVASKYGADSIPLLVLIDTKGRIRAVNNGYDPTADLVADWSRSLDAVLAEKSGKKSSAH